MLPCELGGCCSHSVLSEWLSRGAEQCTNKWALNCFLLSYACTFLDLDNEVGLISLVLQYFCYLITWFIYWVARMNSSIRQTAFIEFTKLINHVCEHIAFLVNTQFVCCSSHLSIPARIPGSSASFSPSIGFLLALAGFLPSWSALLLMLSQL